MRKLCIAGRGSRLATVQNERIRSLLEEQGFEVNILTVSTRGDRDRKSSVTELGGDGPFVRDVEKAVLSGQADLAVHCVKDLPYETAPGLCIAGVPDAADPRDCLIMRRGTDAGFDRRPLIGTGSPRRIRQLDELLERETGFRGEYLSIRGNITTRLEKLQDHAGPELHPLSDRERDLLPVPLRLQNAGGHLRGSRRPKRGAAHYVRRAVKGIWHGGQKIEARKGMDRMRGKPCRADHCERPESSARGRRNSIR